MYQKIISAIFVLTGIFSTMPILTISVRSHLVSVFSVLFAVLFVAIFLLAIDSNRGFGQSRQAAALFTWLLLSMIGSATGALFFISEEVWFLAALSYLPKLILYFCLLLFALKVDGLRQLTRTFLNGFIVGCFLNLSWSILEGYSYYVWDFALNDILFSEYAITLDEGRSSMTIVNDGVIRVSGFNYDPAHLGGIIPIIFLYGVLRKNIFAIALALISLTLSGSTTAFASCALALFISIGKLKIWRRSQSTESAKRVIISAAVVLTILMIAYTNDIVRDGFINNMVGFYERSTENHIKNTSTGERYVYHAYLPEAISNVGPWALTGLGFGTASYSYVSDPDILGRLLGGYAYTPYDPESTYISYLFGAGIFGLICYTYGLVSTLLAYRKKMNEDNQNVVVYASLCSIFFVGFFYHYILTAYQILILIFAAANISSTEGASHILNSDDAQ